MTTEQTTSLVAFIRDLLPCDSDQLWKWVVVNRLANPREDLPATREDMESAMGYLRGRGYVELVAGEFSMKYPQPVERVVGQQELFV